MPRRDPGSVWNLLADLWRELSWIMRVSGCVGLLLGSALGLWLTSHIPASEARYGLMALLRWINLGCAILGATLGLSLGAVVEWIVPKQPRRRNR